MKGKKHNVELANTDYTDYTSGTRHKIILGIDYGTTYSGVSYVTTDKSDIDDINIIVNWPGEPSTSWKTPTRLAYARENPHLEQNKWGFEVDAKVKSYSWTKLLLDKNAEVGDYDDPALSSLSGQGLMTLPPFRDAGGVCEDYLRELRIFVVEKLQQKLGRAILEMTPMECWITLPAIWSEEAKVATLQAAKNAGFANRLGDEIFTIAEPEAAAVATLKKYAGRDQLDGVKPFEHILICDCGGGTVDITTYTITQIYPRLSFDELCIGVGGKCGATYIDRNLHTLLSKRFRNAFDNVPHEQKGPGSKFMTSFEKLKRSFGYDQDRGIREVGPLKLNVPDSMFYDEDERVVKLSYVDMQMLFDPVIQEIINLVSQQVDEAKHTKGAMINRIILVGGFGESMYLHKALEKWCGKNGNIKLMSPEQAQAAVVRGAALRGLEGLAPRMKQARRHYGFRLALPFREGIDAEKNAFTNEFNDEKYCQGMMKWSIAKGESVFKDTYRSFDANIISYTPGRPFEHRLNLYSSALNDAPERFDDPRVEQVGCIVSNFAANNAWGKALQTSFNERLMKKVYQIAFQVQVVFGDKGDNLVFKTAVNGKPAGTAKIEFPKT